MAREKLQELLGMLQAGDPATIEAARAGMLMVHSSRQIDFSLIIHGARACAYHTLRPVNALGAVQGL